MNSVVIRAILASALAAQLFGQSSTGRIVGLITDQSGAVVVGAVVTLRHLNTGANRAVTTGDEGTFTGTNLAVGSYEVVVEHQGFRKSVAGPIVLEVNQTARVDLALQPGSVNETVTIRAEAPIVQTDDSSMGRVVDNSTMVQLPLNGRSYLSLGSLMAGTTLGAPGNTLQRDRADGVALTVNGQRAEHNNYILDGADNNETLFGVAVVSPSLDAIQEFKVQTGNYSAEFGRAAGGIINVSIKSGTNQVHGTAYEFLRNDKFDATNFFVNYSGGKKVPLRYNQFGASGGGPIVKNHLFLFGNYEGFRVRSAVLGGFQVPTPAMRSGDFSGAATVFDPLTLGADGSRTPFPNNRIPADRISASGAKAAAFWPAPNYFGDPARNYLQTFNNPAVRDQMHVRSDWTPHIKDQFFTRLSWSGRDDVAPSIAFNGETTGNHHKGGVAGWTHILSPGMLNDVRFSASLYGFDILSDGTGTDFAAQLGLPSYAPSGLRRFPPISIQNLAGLGGRDAVPLFRKEINYQIVDQFSRITGRHSMKAGIDTRWYQVNNYQPQTMDGQYTFTGDFTGAVGRQYSTGLADLLLGLPVSQRILVPVGFDSTRTRNRRDQLYFQDDIQLTQRLTVNVGLRWEHDGAWRDLRDHNTLFDFSTGQAVYPTAANIPYKLPYPSRFEDYHDFRKPMYKAFAPRFGFAWRPFANNQTVIRSAYGVFWSQPASQAISWSSGTANPPYLLRSQFTSGTTSPQLRFGVFPNVSGDSFVPVNPALFITPLTNVNGYVQMWNLTVQRQIIGGIAVQAGYVGTKGTHLERRYEGNSAPPGPGAINSRRRYPAFQGISISDSSSFSSYHSLQLQAEKRLARGFQFLTAYTWSKSLDDSSSFAGLGGQDGFFAQDPNRLFLEKGRSGFDLRQRFVTSFVYEIPVKFSAKALDLVAGGWQLAGVVTLQSGFPLTPSVGDTSNAGTGVARPNLIANPNLDPSRRTIDQWFNTAAFTLPAPFTFGSAGRNIIDGPGTRGADLSTMKVFRLTERYRVQFRGEFFNFFNHPAFGLPNANRSNAAFGTIRSASPGRQIQFGLKLLF